MKKVFEVLWLDGQNKDGSDNGPVPLTLLRNNRGGFTWYTWGYDEEGHPSRAVPLEDTEVSGSTVKKAMEAARASWSGQVWNLRRRRTRPNPSMKNNPYPAEHAATHPAP